MREKYIKITVKRIALLMFILILVLTGMSYPIVATIQNNKKLAEVTKQYEEETQRELAKLPDPDPVWIRAMEYNESLIKEPFTPPPIGKDSTSPYWNRYHDQLAKPDDAIASLSIPSTGITLPIYHGTSPEVLKKGLGHLFGTSLPIGGQGRAAAIAGHTGMVDSSMFDSIHTMKDGDLAFINVRSETLTYKKVSQEVVPPEAQDAVPVDPNKDLLYLITCTPYGINSDRLIIKLERTENPNPMPGSHQATIAAVKTAPWIKYVKWGAVAIGLLFLVLIIRELLWLKRKLKDSHEEE